MAAAAFGRLCVETICAQWPGRRWRQAAAFGRLCVETTAMPASERSARGSRLRAAVC